MFDILVKRYNALPKAWEHIPLRMITYPPGAWNSSQLTSLHVASELLDRFINDPVLYGRDTRFKNTMTVFTLLSNTFSDDGVQAIATHTPEALLEMTRAAMLADIKEHRAEFEQKTRADLKLTATAPVDNVFGELTAEQVQLDTRMQEQKAILAAADTKIEAIVTRMGEVAACKRNAACLATVMTMLD